MTRSTNFVCVMFSEVRRTREGRSVDAPALGLSIRLVRYEVPVVKVHTKFLASGLPDRSLSLAPVVMRPLNFLLAARGFCCSRPCNSSYLTLLCNPVGLTSPALYRR